MGDPDKKPKVKSKANPNKKAKKEVTPEEKLKKSFNNDLEKLLVFTFGPFRIPIYF